MRQSKSGFSSRLLYSSCLALLLAAVPSLARNVVSEENPEIRFVRSTADYAVPSRNTLENSAPAAGPQDLGDAIAPPPLVQPKAETGRAAETTPYNGAVFSSVAFAIGGLPAKARWDAALTAAANVDFGACATGPCPAGQKAVADAIEASRDKSVPERIAAVNLAVNRAVAYTRDIESYGRRDYWASPQETLLLGKGDCEDYAIAKMAGLKASGIDMNAVALVVLRDVRRKVFHAVLTVSTPKGRLVLDNLHDNVPTDAELPDYQALYSLSAAQTFIHGYPAASRFSAGAGAAGAAVALPGEETNS